MEQIELIAPRRRRLKPSKETLSRMILDEKLTPYEVADKLGYGKDGWSNIYAYCRKYGIEFDGSKNRELRVVDFTPSQLSVIYGGLLGDAYLGKRSASCRVRFHHSVKQIDYLNWKAEHLQNFIVSDTRSTNVMKLPDGSVSSAVAFNTITHPKLNEIRSLCYPDGKKTVSFAWLDQIDELALAVWYMDDGSRNKKYKTLTICTNSFSHDEHVLIQSWLASRWGIQAVIENRRNGLFSIRINASQSSKFLELVRPFVPPCMAYKIGE